MIVKNLKLKDFRNYSSLDLSPGPGINILFGDNAQGKTNILEALYMSSTSLSHRGARDREMIRFGQDEAHIKTIVSSGGRDIQTDIHLKRSGTKGIAVDHVPIRRAADLLGILNTVFFSPEDLNIIKAGPAERRRFLDTELCQLDRIYLSELRKYGKILEQRNQLLKSIPGDRNLLNTLDVWDAQLVSAGTKIIRARQEFTESIGPVIAGIHRELTSGKEEITVHYEPSCPADRMADSLFMARDRDLHLLQTTVGPHRDDLRIEVGGVDMRKYGSQGQQRTCALSLKLSEIQIVEKRTGDNPVLMLDDVMSELDGSRQKDLLSCIGDIQTFITCTGTDVFLTDHVRADHIWKVQNGTVTPGRG